MPATFPAHQGAVLPLKLWHPRWFDGVALAVGAASPDIAYLFDGSNLPVWPFSHEWLGLLGWCLPVTLAVLLAIGRGRLIRQWHGPAPRVTRRPVPFWWVAGSVFVAGTVALPFLPAAFLVHTTGARLIAVAATALLVAALVVPRPNLAVQEAG
jgi:Domain of unknown function (DUF4184)